MKCRIFGRGIEENYLFRRQSFAKTVCSILHQKLVLKSCILFSASKLSEAAAMDGEGLDFDSDFPPKVKKCASRVDNGIDRISELPDGILFVILSFLRVRKAASTTVLSSRWLDLWKQNPNLKFNPISDRISQLPDQIIIAILSLLTVQQVVATSVLSSRWSELWKHSPRLDFNPYEWDMGDHDGLSDEEFIEIVNSVIQSHKALSLKLFRIYFPIKNSAKSAVAKWLEFVFSRQVESLVLDFTLIGDSVMVVLEEPLRETGIICGPPQTLPFCQSLKRLSLRSLKVGGQDVELFLRNCPLLEELMIMNAALTSDINVCGAKLLLKHLDIRLCRGAKAIIVYAPNLSSFRFFDMIKVGKLVLEYVPKLVEADLRYVSSEFVVQHIALISQLQILKLTFSHSKKLSLGMFSHMPNLKKLSICFVWLKNHSPLRLTDLIWASPRLEEFTFKFSIAFNDTSALTEDITDVERSPHQHLRVFKIKTHPEPTDHLVELATYISHNCIALREIVISSRVQEEADWDNIRQQFQGRVPSQIQLRFYSLV